MVNYKAKNFSDGCIFLVYICVRIHVDIFTLTNRDNAIDSW